MSDDRQDERERRARKSARERAREHELRRKQAGAGPTAPDAPEAAPAPAEPDAAAGPAAPDAAADPAESAAARAAAAGALMPSRSGGDTGMTAAAERRIWIWLVIGGLVVLALFLVAFWPVMQARLTAVNQIDQAQSQLSQADNSIASVDKLVTTQLSADAAEGVPDVAPQIAVARRELDQANKLIADGMPRLTEDEQTRASQLKTAVDARRIMIDRAPAILTASVKAVRAKDLGDQASQRLALAATGEQAESALFARRIASAVESASVAVPRIRAQLLDARNLYSQAASAFPQAGFARNVAYVDQRLDAVAQLGQAASRWLADDTAGAAAAFAGYTASAKKATALAAQFPQASGAATGAAFKQLVGGSVSAYEQARKQAQDAEKALRTP